jgi:DNA-binding MarR family transcriptional regulator
MDAFLALFDMIGVLARRRYQTSERFFDALGLNHTEARLLTLLRDRGGAAAQDELSENLHVDRTNAGRALKRLVADGYASSHKADADKRANFIRLTAKGREAALEIGKLKKKIAQSFFRDLSEREAETVASLLSKALAKEHAGRRDSSSAVRGGG